MTYVMMYNTKLKDGTPFVVANTTTHTIVKKFGDFQSAKRYCDKMVQNETLEKEKEKNKNLEKK